MSDGSNTEEFPGEYTDNIGMVEFGGQIRFDYILHPEKYENMAKIFQSLFRLDPSEIDNLVFNSGADELSQSEYPKMVNTWKQKGKWKTKLLWPYDAFQNVQLRGANRWFGADNPWITDPPDRHACMPGVPDDEVNFLMFLLLSGSTIVGPEQ